MHIQEISNGLEKVHYISNRMIDFAVSTVINQNTPLIVEGSPGTGKTSLAKAVSEMLDLPLIRVQFYEGITADKILYDYDYQKQLLTIEAIKSSLDSQLSGKSIEEAIRYVSDIDFYGTEFLIKRPVLKAITEGKCVLLLDELDKSSEEVEYALLEVLDEFSMSIPQLGTITCKEENRPLVFITSNRFRKLSDALKRRCNYIYIKDKTSGELLRILETKVDGNHALLSSVADVLAEAERKKDLTHTPSIAEGIAWASYLMQNKDEIHYVEDSLCFLAKNESDRNQISKMRSVKEFRFED